MTKIISSLLLSLLLIACTVKQEKDEKPIARVLDYYLYQDDIKGIVPPNASATDSTAIIENYIKNWAKKKLILEKAIFNLPDIEAEIEQDVTDYKNARIIYTFEKELVKQQLDTAISEIALSTFYQNHQQDFKLQKIIVKANYVQLNKNAPNIQKAIKWFNSNKDEDYIQLENYCHQYAKKFILDENKWMYLDDLKNESGIEKLDKTELLTPNKVFQIDNEQVIHLFRIVAIKYKNDISPLSLIRKNIRNIIINKRKLELINNMRSTAYQDALNKNTFEIYKLTNEK